MFYHHDSVFLIHKSSQRSHETVDFLRMHSSARFVEYYGEGAHIAAEEAGQPERAHRRLSEIADSLRNPELVRDKMERLRSRMRQRGR